ncbi:MAG: type II toxin-antitoxin system HicB family antitoxin, partial [Gemmatimonadetes bacterium]|nr:type II toxin-antitoxin system HicB family antitoxin [Gemmatimonadota bacterium]
MGGRLPRPGGDDIMPGMDDTTGPDLPSGRFLLRIEPELHALLRQEAESSGLSLNE